MKNIITQSLTFVILFFCANVFAQKVYELSSPDGKLRTTVSVGDHITYTLTHELTGVLAASPISMTLASGEALGKTPKGVKVRRSTVDRTVASPFYKKSTVVEKYNEMVLTFNGSYGLIFRAYNDGLAYRFTTSRKGDMIIVAEEFTLNFPKDYMSFSAYSRPEGAFENQMINSFEGTYTHKSISELDVKKLIYLPMYIALDEGKKLVITEVDLYGYPGTFFNGNGVQSLNAVYAKYPKKTELRRYTDYVVERENYMARTAGARNFPWRVMIVAENDAALLSNDLVYSLAEPCRIADPSWIKPGISIWDWWHNTALTGVDFHSGMNTETFKHYIDFAAKYGLEYVQVDAGWSVNYDNFFEIKPEIDIAELVRYGESKNVGILLWVLYRTFHQDMENISRHYADMGVKGFKIDFMDRDDQQIADFIYAAAETCAKYKLLINLHGIHKPTGLQRTWPNVINYEGVMGLEVLKFGEAEFPLDLVTNEVTIPFIRMVAGPLDYTPGAMINANKENFRFVYSEPMSQGTRCRQLAAYIVFDAPLAMMVDRPSNYEKEQECANFISKTPTVWEQTVPLENKISEYVSVARKKGGEWYIGGMTNWNERELTFDLSFLGDGNFKAELFTDGVNANRIASDYKKEVINIPANRKLTIKMAQGGGFAARIYQ